MTEPAGRGPLPVPPPVVHAVAVALGVVAHRLRPVPVSRRRRTLMPGAALVAAATVTVGLVVRELRRTRTPFDPRRPAAALVTTGPFRRSRHPAYVALAAFHLGLGLLLNNAWVLLLAAPSAVIVDRWMITREERHLAERFGEAYARYRRSVRRWL